jgi:nucleoside-diphosphate-sugar epimerase
VRCLSRKPGGAESAPSVRWYHTEFGRPDLGLGDEVFRGVDVVYHLAGATRATSEAAFHDANVGVTARVMDRITRAGVSARFVYISSQAAAGPSPSGARTITEADVAAPLESYGRSKLAAERAVLARRGAFEVTIVRPVAVYGPGDKDFLSIFRMVRRGVAAFPGIRDAVIDTIFVDDLIRGIIDASRSPMAVGKTYFMGNPQSASWRAIYREVAKVVDRADPREINIPLSIIRLGAVVGDISGWVTGHPPLLNSSKAALAAPRFWTCSSQQATTDFGFTATTSLHDGLRATYDWYLRHRWL